MQHPFDALAAEYAHYWAAAKTNPEREREVEEVVQKLLDGPHLKAFTLTEQATDVPVLWHAPVLYRESDGDLNTYLGNGDPLDRKTVDVPRDRGPFSNYESGAIDSLRYDHVILTPASLWVIERVLYEDESWNGFGYRNKGLIPPYLVGGTNLQQLGKYTSDGRFDPHHMDEQLGTIPIMKRIIEMRPEFILPSMFSSPPQLQIFPQPVPEGHGGDHDAAWIQASLNRLGYGELTVDGSYGRRTKRAVYEFQADHNLETDGLAGPLTIAALSVAIAGLSGKPLTS